jgi:membrane protein implicated in regulation of membrane protease activity
MYNDQLRTLRIVVIIAVVIGILAALFYLVYSFTLFWQAFAAGITIGFLLIILFVLLVLAIYLWVKNFLIKRELKKQETELEQIKIELNRYKARLMQENTEKSE